LVKNTTQNNNVAKTYKGSFFLVYHKPTLTYGAKMKI